MSSHPQTDAWQPLESSFPSAWRQHMNPVPPSPNGGEGRCRDVEDVLGGENAESSVD